MFLQCRDYLIAKLKAAGIKTPPITSEKVLASCKESHLGAVLLERDTFNRNGSKTYFTDETGACGKRRKVFDRELAFTVTIGDYTAEKAEAIFETFVAGLDMGIYIGGNFTPITLEAADWIDKDDSILNAKIAVQAVVTFSGGVYRDTGFAKVRELEVTAIEKEDLPHGK